MKIRLGALILIILFSHICAAETIFEVIPLNNRPASEIQPLLRPLLDNADQVIADGANLLVRTSPERLDEIRKLVNQLDTRQRNLIITVLQSRLTTADRLNAAAGIRLNIPAGDLSRSSGKISGRFQQSRNLGSNESTQTIRTLEGNTAYIKAGGAYPVKDVQIYDPGFGYPSVSTSTRLIEATTGFAVTPRLAGQQAILEVSPWSDTFNSRGQIQTQGAQSVITVNLGQWVELGSIDENSSHSGNRTLAQIRQTGANNLHILVKVDIADQP